jgi:MoxR-like ATPase
MEGTFQLPEAQRDRFQQKLTVNLPGRTDERSLLDRFDETPELGPAHVEAVTDSTELLSAGKTALKTHVAPSVKEYVLDIIDATGDHDDIEHGASPRASRQYQPLLCSRGMVPVGATTAGWPLSRRSDSE